MYVLSPVCQIGFFFPTCISEHCFVFSFLLFNIVSFFHISPNFGNYLHVVYLLFLCLYHFQSHASVHFQHLSVPLSTFCILNVFFLFSFPHLFLIWGGGCISSIFSPHIFPTFASPPNTFQNSRNCESDFNLFFYVEINYL